MSAIYRGELRPLSELDDYEIEEGYPDIRGWTLYDEAGRDIGEVKDLLVDTSRNEVTYATIDLNDKTRMQELFDDEANARVPVTALTFDEDNEAVRLTRPLDMLSVAETETGFATAAVGAEPAAPGARAGEEGTVEIVEERLDIEKQRRKAGEVRIGKEVETETVRREVPVEHEEVIIEREPVREPISPAEARPHLEGREGEITVPVYGEEVEVTKRPIVAERLRIRKRMVQDTREVAADVRKERATVEGEGAIRDVPEGRTGPGATAPETEPGRKPPRP